MSEKQTERSAAVSVGEPTQVSTRVAREWANPSLSASFSVKLEKA